MSMSTEHVTKKRRSSGIAIIGMSWLTMTLGLFFATLAGEFVSTIGAAEWMVHLIQAVVIISIVLPVLLVIRRHFHMKSVLLPLTGKKHNSLALWRIICHFSGLHRVSDSQYEQLDYDYGVALLSRVLACCCT